MAILLQQLIDLLRCHLLNLLSHFQNLLIKLDLRSYIRHHRLKLSVASIKESLVEFYFLVYVLIFLVELLESANILQQLPSSHHVGILGVIRRFFFEGLEEPRILLNGVVNLLIAPLLKFQQIAINDQSLLLQFSQESAFHLHLHHQPPPRSLGQRVYLAQPHQPLSLFFQILRLILINHLLFEYVPLLSIHLAATLISIFHLQVCQHSRVDHIVLAIEIASVRHDVLDGHCSLLLLETVLLRHWPLRPTEKLLLHF